ncbi:MAG TPA: hypothetical protein VJN19_01635, partial [Propionibacteriaceae bacterium]|nr:hypothetical protein [Propionibacteriaceae bacterium]
MDLREAIDGVEEEIKGKQAVYEKVEEELEALELQKTLLQAELAGLSQRLKTLEAVLAKSSVAAGEPANRPGRDVPAIDVTKLTLVDAVLHVINETPELQR